MYQDPPTHEPTPAEIEAAAAATRATWTPAIESQRRGVPEYKAYEVPVCKFPSDIYDLPRDEASY